MTPRRPESGEHYELSNAGCDGEAGAYLEAIALDDLLTPLAQHVILAADLSKGSNGTVDVFGLVGG